MRKILRMLADTQRHWQAGVGRCKGTLVSRKRYYEALATPIEQLLSSVRDAIAVLHYCISSESEKPKNRDFLKPKDGFLGVECKTTRQSQFEQNPGFLFCLEDWRETTEIDFAEYIKLAACSRGCDRHRIPFWILDRRRRASDSVSEARR